jgi:hypothetical protein
VIYVAHPLDDLTAQGVQLDATLLANVSSAL